MKLRIPAAAALVIGAFLIGRVGQAGDDATKAVPATKYRVKYAESVCDYIHGGALPVHGLFLPDAKVAAHLEYRSDLGGPDGSYRERPVLHAYPAEKAGEAIPEKEGEQPKIVNITIPQDLAKQIEDHAALTKRYRDEGIRLGSEVRACLGLEPIPTDGSSPR